MAERYASLPMYDLPALRAATDDWWAGLARHFAAAGLAGAPAALTRPGGGYDHWVGQDLLFSQTCGYPLVTELAGKVGLVATPCYDVAGCDGPLYRSVIVVAADSDAESLEDLRGARCAVSSAGSWSGHQALRDAAAPYCADRPLFGAAAASGGHGASIAMVSAGEADVAAIDCVTFALLAEHGGESVAGVRVLGCTAPAPGLPYITALSTSAGDIGRLRDGLRAAISDADLASARRALRIAGVEILDPEVYAGLLDRSKAAADAGMPALI